MSTDKVSVLVTFYNQEEYADKAIESIVSQKTDFGVKILVGDDGSTDNTCNIVNNWIAKYPDKIKLFSMNHDEDDCIPGFRASRNRINLLHHVDTEYFIFLDGDDYFDHELKLQKQVEILDAEDNKDCIACGHNTTKLYIKSGKTEPATDPNLKEGKIDPRKYWKKHYIHTDSLLFRSSIISRLDLKLMENSYNDNMITFSAIQFGNIYYIPEPWAVYVQTNDGIWTKGNQLINLIRNMIFYDQSCIINPSMRKESMCKFSYIWNEIYKMRNTIDPSKLEAYKIEASDKNCKNAYKWIMYPTLSKMQKQSLCLKTFMIVWSSKIFRRI